MTAVKKKRTRKQPQPASPPNRFFQKQLAAEEAPSLETMKALFTEAAATHMVQPWHQLEEDQLVIFQEPVSGDLCFCSVMGALGEARVVQVYIGLQSYFWFKKIHAGEAASVGDYLANQHSVYVDYVRPSEMTPPDRELAKAMGHPLARGTDAPVFRTIRPGYHPWYVTEGEARILTQGLQAVLAALDLLLKNEVDLWVEEDVYPLVEFITEHADHTEYTIRRVRGPSEAATMPKLPELDETRIRAILDRRLASAGNLEVDHFYSAVKIGAAHERKACMRIALAIDAKTALAYPPQVSAPEESIGTMLQQVVLEAIEAKRALPAEVHVRNREFKILLDRLGETLGFRVKVKDSLPALEFAKSEMQLMLGDPGLAP